MRQQAYAELADLFAETSEWFGKMADWHDVVSWRQTDAEYFRKLEGEMFAIALVYRRMAQGEARRMKMRRTILTGMLLMILMFVLVSGMPAVAQDEPLATNTPDAVIAPVVATLNGEPVEATLVAPGTSDDSAPPVVVVEQPDRTLYVIGLIVFLIATLGGQIISNRSLGGLTAALSKQAENKQLIDEGIQRYMQSSLSTQQYIQLATHIAGIIGQMIPGEDLAEVAYKFGEKVIGGEQPPGDVSASVAPGTILQPRKIPYSGEQPGYPPRDPASYLTGPDVDGGLG